MHSFDTLLRRSKAPSALLVEFGARSHAVYGDEDESLWLTDIKYPSHFSEYIPEDGFEKLLAL